MEMQSAILRAAHFHRLPQAEQKKKWCHIKRPNELLQFFFYGCIMANGCHLVCVAHLHRHLMFVSFITILRHIDHSSIVSFKIHGICICASTIHPKIQSNISRKLQLKQVHIWAAKMDSTKRENFVSGFNFRQIFFFLPEAER